MSMAARRGGVVIVLLLVASGVLTMHLMSLVGSPVPAAESAEECHHEGSCSASPMRHLDMVCLASAIVLVVAMAMIRARRSSSHRQTAVVRTRRVDLVVPRSTPRITELCILRC